MMVHSMPDMSLLTQVFPRWLWNRDGSRLSYVTDAVVDHWRALTGLEIAVKTEDGEPNFQIAENGMKFDVESGALKVKKTTTILGFLRRITLSRGDDLLNGGATNTASTSARREGSSTMEARR